MTRVLSFSFAAMLVLPLAAAAQTPPPRPPAPASTSHPARRPSMVGYIEDGTVSTSFRFRFDTDNDITDPDRAEFFYAKCGCYTGLPSTNAFFDPNAPGNPAGIVIDTNAEQLYFQGEYAFKQNRVSVFGELPVRWLRPQAVAVGTFANETGLSDLRVGAKIKVVDSDKGYATAMLRLTLPTGDAGKGLGTNHTSVEPVLMLSRDLGPKAGIEGEFGGVIPVGGSAGLPTSGSEKFAGSILYYGIGPSFDVYSSQQLRLTPVVELVGWRVLGGFQTGNPTITTGPDTGFGEASVVAPNIVNLKIGARLTLRNASSIYIGYGHHLTDAAWYKDVFRVEYRVPLGR